LFEFQLLKGAGMKASWGYSLDFVPHISGWRVRWHRSDKSARLDVIVDPHDLPQPSFIHGAAHLAAGLLKLLPQAVTRAQVTWERGATFSGMLDIVREIRERKTNRFGFYNYTQLPIAYVFISANVGDLHAAAPELDHYLESHRLDHDEAAKLKKAFGNYVVV
jgi:hypothetical protein